MIIFDFLKKHQVTIAASLLMIAAAGFFIEKRSSKQPKGMVHDYRLLKQAEANQTEPEMLEVIASKNPSLKSRCDTLLYQHYLTNLDAQKARCYGTKILKRTEEFLSKPCFELASTAVFASEHSFETIKAYDESLFRKTASLAEAYLLLRRCCIAAYEGTSVDFEMAQNWLVENDAFETLTSVFQEKQIDIQKFLAYLKQENQLNK